MKRWLGFSPLVLLLVALLVTPAISLLAQQPDGTPPQPAPANKPISPGERPQDYDDIGYCIIGGPLSAYCDPFGLNPDCVPLPTSLLVPVIPFQQDIVGWSSTPDASGCGTEPCFLILRCECGQTLLNQVCGV